MTSTDTVIAVDVGNSAIKIAVEDPSTDELAYHSFLLDNPRWTERACRWVERFVATGPSHWMVSTVNRRASGPLRDAVAERFPASSWQLIGHADIPIRIDVDHPDRVGVDRIVGAFAACNRHSAPLIVVDAGSAVTVDLVGRHRDGDSVFSGGAIYPGVQLQHAALETGTENLTRADKRAVAGLSAAETMGPGKNTEQAIRLGVIASVVGAVERLVEAYGELYPADPRRLVVTGGDGALISAHLRVTHDHIPQLVCLGLLDLWKSTLPHHN